MFPLSPQLRSHMKDTAFSGKKQNMSLADSAAIQEPSAARTNPSFLTWNLIFSNIFSRILSGTVFNPESLVDFDKSLSSQ